MSAEECIAAAKGGAGEVVAISGIEVRQSLWGTSLQDEFPNLSVGAMKLLSMHVTSCAAERNLSQSCRLYDKLRGQLAITTGEKVVFVSQSRKPRAVARTDEEVLVSELVEVPPTDSIEVME